MNHPVSPTRELFGTDGIRGKAGQYPLNPAGAKQVGKAIGAYFAQPGERIVIGRDPRQSSQMLESAVSAGLSAVGVQVQTAGVLPTPGVAYLTKITGAKAGVVITASHNPYDDNGIKVFSAAGGKLPDNTEAQLNELINSHIADQNEPADETRIPTDAYEDFLLSTAAKAELKGLKIAIDCANGATSQIAARVFKNLGADAVSLFDQPNGTNINAGCGATHPAPLQAIVSQQSLAAGIAFDGDGDRVLLVDEHGRLLTGDHLLYILALTGRHREVVATVMSNMGLELALKQQGIKLHRTAVGDRYVLQELEKTGATLGGEQSGHIILTKHATTGDGLLAAIQTLKAVRASGKSLSDWYQALPLLPQQLINLPLADKTLLQHPKVQAFIADQATKLGERGRLNVRASGTEPIVRVMVEAPNAADRAQEIAGQLSQLMSSLGTGSPQANITSKQGTPS